MAGTGVLKLPSAASGVANYASTPSTAALNPTTAIDLRLRAATAWQAAGGTNAIQKLSAGQLGYAMNFLSGSGVVAPGLYLSVDGVNWASVLASVNLPRSYFDGWFRMTWRSSDGRVQFFANPDSNDVPTVWTQLGADRSLLVGGSIFASNQPLAVGTASANAHEWQVRRAQVWNGIEGAGGALVWDADFTKQPDGTTSFVEDASGLTVTVNGSARICNRVAA